MGRDAPTSDERATLDSVLHYQLEESLGSGGMGMVFRAVDTRLGRSVALKFLAKELIGDEEARERLIVEARLAARLDHPNIGTIYAIEETADQQLFLAMAYYPGETLRDRLDREALAWPEALQFAREVLQALVYAHDQGIIHRDVKPGNIMLSPQGAKLLDFGLATLRDTKGMAEGATGTVMYMSPEQVRGQPFVDARADMWSFAVVLYEMLTGAAPFGTGGGMAKLILNIVSRDPEPVSSLAPGVPEAVDSLLQIALAKDPEDRYEGAAEMLQDLEAIAQGEAGRTPQRQPEAPAPDEPTSRQPAPTNLVSPKNPLVGRLDERALIEQYLADSNCQVITLLGLGGVGKTRLALQVAADRVTSGHSAEGVFIVELDGLDHPDLITSSIADVFDLDLHPLEDDVEQIVAEVGSKHLLLVLDNFEHLMDGVALVHVLVRGCPNLKLLVTSRERLQLPEEYVVPLQGLPYPEPGAGLEEAAESEAVELFAQRARQVDSDFVLDEANQLYVVEICALVFGLPLGLELAAAWTRILEPEEIVAEIKSDGDFLSTSSRTVTERHRSIRAVFDYSWRLLTPAEQSVLMGLSVFRGGASKLAAQAVAGASLDLLSQLADKSLLARTDAGTFEQHGLLQQYARQKLAEVPEREKQVLAGHAHFFLELLTLRCEALRRADADALEEIETSLDNIRTGWRYATHEVPSELKMAAEPLRRFFEQRNLLRNGVELFSQTLDDLTGASEVAGIVAVHLSWLRLRQGEFDDAIELGRRGLEQLESSENHRELQVGSNTMGAALASKGDYAAARPHFEAALESAVLLGDDGVRIMALENLAMVEQRLGEFEKARDDFEQSLELARKQGHAKQMVTNLNNLSSLLLSMGRPELAEPHLHEGLELAKQSGLKQMLPFFLGNLGLAASAQGNYQAGKRHLLDALKILRGSNQRSFEAALLAELGQVAIGLGEVVEGDRYFLRSLQNALELEELPLALHVTALAGAARVDQEREGAADLLRLVADHPATLGEDRTLAEECLGRLGAIPSGSGSLHDLASVVTLLDDVTEVPSRAS